MTEGQVKVVRVQLIAALGGLFAILIPVLSFAFLIGRLDNRVNVLESAEARRPDIEARVSDLERRMDRQLEPEAIDLRLQALEREIAIATEIIVDRIKSVTPPPDERTDLAPGGRWDREP